MEFIGAFTGTLHDQFAPDGIGGFTVVTETIATDGDCKVFTSGTRQVYLWGSIYNSADFTTTFGESPGEAHLISLIYNKYGADGFKYLDGDYTLVVKDADLLLAYRDRHGAGPHLYYTDRCFVSHQNKLLTVNGLQLRPNFRSLSFFLTTGYIPSPQTALDGVSKLTAGSLIEMLNGSLSVRSLYSFADFGLNAAPLNISFEDAKTEYIRLHQKSIANRIKGAKSVKILLSGGYDSGGNLSALRDVYQGHVSSYSVGFKDNPWSELPLAKILSETYGTSHHEYEIDGGEVESLPQIVRLLGDPFVENGMMVNYTAFRMVKNQSGPGIVIGGDGNDQHFGTSGRELGMYFKFRSSGLYLFQNLIGSVSNLSVFERDNILFKIRFHNDKVRNKFMGVSFGYRDAQLKQLLRSSYAKPTVYHLDGIPTRYSTFDELFLINNYYSSIRQEVNEVILFKASKIADSFGESISFPYMSTELYDFLRRLPRSFKLKGSVDEIAKGQGVSKFLHKSCYKPKLPEAITNRKKQGGFAPMAMFFGDSQRFAQIADIIRRSSLAREHMNKGYLDQLLKRYEVVLGADGSWFWYKQIQAFQLFSLLTLAIWWEQMMEGSQAQHLSDFGR